MERVAMQGRCARLAVGWVVVGALASSAAAQNAAPPIPEPFDLKAQTPSVDATFGWTMAMGKLGAPGHDPYDDVVISAFDETVNGSTKAGAGYPFLGPGLTPTPFPRLIASQTPQPGIELGLLRVAIGDTRGGLNNLIFLPTWTLAGTVTGCGTVNRGAVQAFDAFQGQLPLVSVSPPDHPSSCNVSSFGHSVATGDVDGDTIEDLVAGAHGTNGVGRVYVFFGHAGFATPPFQAPWVAIDPNPSFAFSEFGVEVQCCDLDGDGHAEVLVGQSERAGASQHKTGKVLVYRGTSVAAITGNPPISNAMPTELLEDTALQGGDEFGYQIFVLGDVGSVGGTPDLRPDVGVYAEYSGGGALRGKLYVFFNDSTGPGSASFLDSTNWAGLVSPAGTPHPSGLKSRFGRGAASVDWPDVNGSVRRGLVIGEPGGSPVLESGRCFLVYGPFAPSPGPAKTTPIVNSWAAPLLNPVPQIDSHFGACIVTGKYSGAYAGQQIVISAREARVSGQTKAGHAYAFHP